MEISSVCARPGFVTFAIFAFSHGIIVVNLLQPHALKGVPLLKVFEGSELFYSVMACFCSVVQPANHVLDVLFDLYGSRGIVMRDIGERFFVLTLQFVPCLMFLICFGNRWSDAETFAMML